MTQHDRPPLPDAARRIIRQAAEFVLNPPAAWLDAVDRATLSAPSMRAIADDPVLSAAMRRANRSNLTFWAATNVRDPGGRVPANADPVMLTNARDLVRRGQSDAALDTYRVGQNVAWRYWMQLVFSLTSDPDELREVLDATSRSISAFLDATMAAIATQIALERQDLTRGTNADRREAVTLILEGAPIPRQRAEAKLGYTLTGSHTAAVIWTEEADYELGDLECLADALGRSASAAYSLSVIASAATLWVWVPGTNPPDPDRLTALLSESPGIRIALGPVGRGVEGFRRSHVDAVTTQRLVSRLRSEQRVVSFDDVQLVALITQDPGTADEFVQTALGAFASASPELRESVRTFIRAQCNASAAAAALYTHRNTLLRRLVRADELLPRPLGENLLQVAAALEVLHWRQPSA